MFGRRTCVVFAAIFCMVAAGLLHAENRLLSEVRFVAHNSAEKTAGVWVDGQYLGYVKELTGDKKMLLLPGKHEIVVRQPWYKDYVDNAVLEPGELHTVELSLSKDARTPPKDATGELKIATTPERAAVFVDQQFAGHAEEFDGHGRAMLLTPGQHHVRIALPGYLPFETTVNLRPYQKLKIKTELVRGSIIEAGSLVSKTEN
jgi:PEGA domain-containing protein